MFATIAIRVLRASVLGAVLIAGAAPGLQAKKLAPVQMITAGAGGSWFPTGATIGDLANSAFEGQQPISVIPGAGALGNISRVGNNKSDMGLSYGPFLKLATEGGNEVNPGKGFKDLRAIMSLTPYPFHILVADSANIESLEGLKDAAGNIRIASEVTGSSIHFITQRMFKLYKLPLEQMVEAGGTLQQLSTNGRKSAWQNRQINMAVFMFDPPHPVIIELMRMRDSQLFGFSGDVLESLTNDMGFLTYELSPEQYPNQKKTVTTIGMPTLLFGRADLDEELVYQMAKKVAENKPRMVNAVATFKSWEPKNMPHGLAIETHPGALRYYRERGWIK